MSSINVFTLSCILNFDIIFLVLQCIFYRHILVLILSCFLREFTLKVSCGSILALLSHLLLLHLIYSFVLFWNLFLASCAWLVEPLFCYSLFNFITFCIVILRFSKYSVCYTNRINIMYALVPMEYILITVWESFLWIS